MRFKLPKIRPYQVTLALAVTLCAEATVVFGQTTAPTIQDLVRQATARADALREQMGDISGTTAQKVQAYRQQAEDLTAGNADRVRQGLPLLGQGYSKDSLDSITPNKDGVVYVAVSLSMPVPALRQLVTDAEKAKVQVVIQGPINGSFKQLIERMRSVFSENEIAGIAIDPRVFEQYRIDQVPAFVSAPVPVEGCPSGLDCERDEVPHDILRGNVTLAYALKSLSEQGDVAPLAAKDALERLDD